VNGVVDGNGRALLQIYLCELKGIKSVALEPWIDTGFTGHLMVPRTDIASLGLPLAQIGTAFLADGSSIQTETYLGRIEWFGQPKFIEVIAADGMESLLGIGLLLGHQLHIDYANNTLTLT
jgi:clan AA aspartic protease